MKHLFLFFFASILMLSSCGGSSEKVLLNLNLDQGSSFCVTTSTKAVGGPMEYSSGGEYCFTAKDVNANEIVFSVKANLVDHNSMDDEFMDQELMEELGFIGEQEYRLVLTNRGEVKENFTDRDGYEFNELIDITNLQVQFPDYDIGEGDSWEVDQANTLLDQPVKATYEVTKVSSDQVKLDYTGNIGGGTILGPMTKKGEYTIDRNTGLVLEGSFEMSMMTGGKAVFTCKKTK